MAGDALPRRYRSKWRDVVLICAKCSRKADGGFGRKGRTGLDKLIRKKLHLAKGRRGALGVVEVGCFGLCPRDAVTVALGSEPDALYAIPAGTRFSQLALTLRLGPVDPSES